MVNCRVCEVRGTSEDDVVFVEECGCCCYIHTDCATICEGCDRAWCEEHFEEGGDIQGVTYCPSCYEGMMDALEDHFAAGREHGDW